MPALYVGIDNRTIIADTVAFKYDLIWRIVPENAIRCVQPAGPAAVVINATATFSCLVVDNRAVGNDNIGFCSNVRFGICINPAAEFSGIVADNTVGDRRLNILEISRLVCKNSTAQNSAVSPDNTIIDDGFRFGYINGAAGFRKTVPRRSSGGIFCETETRTRRKARP